MTQEQRYLGRIVLLAAMSGMVGVVLGVLYCAVWLRG